MTEVNFQSAVKGFLSSADWLTDEDLPAIMVLRAVAAELDAGGKLSPALVAQFGLTHRALLKRKPTAAPEDNDPLETALRG